MDQPYISQDRLSEHNLRFDFTATQFADVIEVMTRRLLCRTLIGIRSVCGEFASGLEEFERRAAEENNLNSPNLIAANSRTTEGTQKNGSGGNGLHIRKS
jgi:hypothetical protein